MSARLKAAVIISGGGSNLKALIAAAEKPDCAFAVTHVICNRPDAGGLAHAAAGGIPATVIDHKAFASREAFDAALDAELKRIAPDIVALAGFMRILTAPFIESWRGKMTNIHPSLLPLYKGLHPHAQALAAGASVHGCTVHWVTPGVDEGPIIAQAEVPILTGDTEEVLQARTLIEEHKLYARALTMIAKGEAVYPA
ncbi:MAG: phosphoribosylglycinamide formyltransferase [Micropepsaceae bacterium]